jgi:hypothetical protein
MREFYPPMAGAAHRVMRASDQFQQADEVIPLHAKFENAHRLIQREVAAGGGHRARSTARVCSDD